MQWFTLWHWWNELYAKFICHFIRNIKCPDSLSFPTALCLLLSSLLGNGINTGMLVFLLKKRRLKRGRAQMYFFGKEVSERNRLEVSYQQNRKLLKPSVCKDAACGTVVFIFLSTFSLFDPLSWTSFPLQRSPCRYREQVLCERHPPLSVKKMFLFYRSSQCLFNKLFELSCNI